MIEPQAKDKSPSGTERAGEHFFKHSRDYRSINKDGQDYTLTTNQAIVIDLLHENYKQGTPDISQTFILDTIGTNTTRLRDVFKDNPEAWNNLVAQGKRKGLYRLNI